MGDVEVCYAGQTCATIPYASLPAFHLFCKQSGFQIRWEARQGRYVLDPGLKGKTCILLSGMGRNHAGADLNLYEQDVLARVEHFLADAGANVVLATDRSRLPQQRDVCIQFTVKEGGTAVSPSLTIFQDQSRRNNTLVRSLQEELKHAGMPCVSELRYESRPLHPFAEVRCQLPANIEQSEWKEWAERIAFFFASGILRYFQAEGRISPLSCLPLGVLKGLAGGGVPQRQETFPPPQEAAGTEGAVGKKTAQEDMQAQESAPAREEKQPVGMPDVAGASPLLVGAKWEAEVFFDYTVIRSDIEGKPFLIFGNLYVKNTGTEDLINPVVCLRADPPGSIMLAGQVLPADMVETLGVQSSAGVKGWRFMEDGWFGEAKERGEYWMAPVQPVSIAPKEVQLFQNFRITVMKPESGNSVTIEGYVFFHEQGLQFASNNRIAVSC